MSPDEKQIEATKTALRQSPWKDWQTALRQQPSTFVHRSFGHQGVPTEVFSAALDAVAAEHGLRVQYLQMDGHTADVWLLLP